VTDFLGGGEMGYWEGPGTYNHANPISSSASGTISSTRKTDYEIRVTNELEEALFLDRLQLAIDHQEHPYIERGHDRSAEALRLFAVKISGCRQL
jgi:hypothetical protein